MSAKIIDAQRDASSEMDSQHYRSIKGEGNFDGFS